MNTVNEGAGAASDVSGLQKNRSGRLSPGEILHEGRLAHDYSVDDLCAQTKLSAEAVRALEDNDFQALSHPVFARGYYRQCAKVLDLDVNYVTAAYNAQAGESTISQAYRRQTRAGRVSKTITPGGVDNRRLFILLVLALAAIVAIAAIVFVFPSNRISDKIAGRNKANDQKNQKAAVAPASSPHNTRQRQTVADSNNNANRQTPAIAGSGADQARAGQQAGGQDAGRSLGARPLGGASHGHQGGTSDDHSHSAPAVPNSRLVLTFSKRCWTSVTDANGHRLARGIFKAGDKKILNGTPPYTLYLGFAPGVKVSIGGHPVDVSSRAHQSVAHLTVHAPDG